MSGRDLREFLAIKERSTDHWGEILFEAATALDSLNNEYVAAKLIEKIVAEAEIIRLLNR